jgi:hypothetical protein
MCKKLLIFVLMLGLVSTAIGQPTGEMLFEFWYNIGGVNVGDLTSQASYPDNPDDGELRPSFDSILDGPDNYGQRAHGWLYPPEDGDYTFWIASDDGSTLYLSTDDDPANAVVIAKVPDAGWTSYQQWDAYPDQQSAPITLAAGGKYYIEALMKEGGGGDSLTVAWAGPGIGEDITVIDGAYLSPGDPAPSLLKAKNPVPANGAVDVDTAMLEWASGFNAVSHVAYLNGELLAETEMNLAAATLAPGTSYTWRVDEVQADGTVIEGNTWSFTTLPLEAHFPSPADGAENVGSPVTLSWTPGKNTIINYVYFGTDEAAVAARTATRTQSITASLAVGELDLFTTYYWAVDEFTPPPGGTVAGPVWSFSTEKYILIEDSITLEYDNTAEPYVSEAAIDTVADLTAGGAVSDLTLSFQGMAGNLSIDEDTGTYSITGEGADIWGNSDQFHYVYMQLTGDGEISARVVSNGTGSNTWAKGGVMIRETTAPDSRHMIMGMTGSDGGGIAFQGRFAATGAASSGLHGDITASPPHWVKIVRTGNEISGYHSADGQTWDLFTDTSPDNAGGNITNPQPIEGLPDTVLIGLFVTSHADGENRTYVFDNVDIQGNVDGVIVSEDIASVSGNSAESIYVALEDLTGAVAAVAHPYAAATQLANRAWTIPLSAFEGVDATQAAKLYVGVGDGEAGGKGAVTFTDIKVVEGASAGNIIWVSDAYDQNPIPGPDDQDFVDLLEAAGYTVDYTMNAPGDGYWRTLDDDKIAALNAADLVIVSRNTDSGSYDDGDEIAQWNAVTAPIILNSTHIVRNSRWNWLNTGDTLNMAPVMELADGTSIQAIDEAVGLCSFAAIESAGNGTVLATGDGLVWIAQWEAGVEYYDGAGQTAGGPRVFFVAGAQEETDAALYPGRGDMNLTPDGVAVFLAVVDDMIPDKLSDITAPGDIVQGVPNQPETDWNDVGWPPNENPGLAIDNNTGTKFLHFAGDIGPSGIRITPLDGPSVVNGLTLTTANDAPNRDPVTFKLSGSNVGIDGPYLLIAEGDIVDFAGEAEWPRFTKNATPITFENDMSYAHYQLMFPTVRNPDADNSMQIAEVELLGVLGEGAEPENLVLNPSFEEDEAILDDPDWYSWGTWNPAEGAGSNATIVDTDAADGARSLLIEPVGPENWHFIVLSLPIPTEVGAIYTASFSAKAAEARPLGVQFKATDNSVQWGYADFNLTTEWAEYSLTAAAENAETKLEFFCAASEVSFLLDSVSVIKVGDAPPPSVPGENLLGDGGFEAGPDTQLGTWEPLTWNLYSEGQTLEVVSGDAIEGDYCLKVTVPEATANAWDAGFKQPGHVFEAGKLYTLSAWMKSLSGPLDVNMKLERDGGDYFGYEEMKTITEEWAQYSITPPFAFTETLDPAAATFHIGFAVGEFLMDDIVLTAE